MAGCGCVLSPVFGLDSSLHIVLFPLCCVSWSKGSAVVCVWCACGGIVSHHSLLLCVCCHTIVGLVLRLCGMGVSFANSGGGLCWGGRAVVSVVCCQSIVCCGLWNGGGGMVLSLVSFSLSSFLLLLICVGVRGSARAAMRARTLSPNTNVFPCSLLLVVFSSLFPPLPFFTARLSVVGMAAGRVHHVSVCSVGMTAIGSLSLSSLFFW